MLVFPAKCLLGARSKMKYYFAVVIAVKDLHLFPHRAGEMLNAFGSWYSLAGTHEVIHQEPDDVLVTLQR